jgi:U3 small nucleolar RNA-associated protein 14
MITATFIAHNKREEGGGYNRTFQISSEQELEQAINDFDESCPFERYEMETFATSDDGEDLTPEQRSWFEAQDQKNNIGF